MWLGQLCRGQGMVLAAMDLQWADRPSARASLFAGGVVGPGSADIGLRPPEVAICPRR